MTTVDMVGARPRPTFQERRGGLPRAMVHHDQGGAFLSHEWVGQLLLGDRKRVSGTLSLREEDSLMGPRGNPVMESFFSRAKVRALPVTKWENRDLFLAVHLGCRGPQRGKAAILPWREAPFGARVRQPEGYLENAQRGPERGY